MGFNYITEFKLRGRSILVPPLSMQGPPLFDKNMEDWRCKPRVIRDVPKILMQTRVALVQGCEDLEEFYVLLETKFSADSSKTSDNIFALDSGTISGVLRVLTFWRNMACVPLS